MDFSHKIQFLQDSLKLKDKEFAKRYGIKNSVLKKWKSGEILPEFTEITSICNDFSLDPKDFLDKTSTLVNPSKEEHLCKFVPRTDNSNTIYEDFAREDNSRYEEKD